jgi:hypothetical protein
MTTETLDKMIGDMQPYVDKWRNLSRIGMALCGFNLVLSASWFLDAWSLDKPWLSVFGFLFLSVGVGMYLSYSGSLKRGRKVQNYIDMIHKHYEDLSDESGATLDRKIMACDQMLAYLNDPRNK